MTREPAVPCVAKLLRRAQWRVAAFALLCAGLLLTVAGLYTLHDNETRAMTLVARSLAFAGEPALRFGDHAAMLELIESQAETARLSEVQVFDAANGAWLDYRKPDTGATDRWARGLERLLTPKPAQAGIGDGPPALGRIELRSDGQAVLHYVEWAIASLLACLLASFGVVELYARRLTATIVTPLAALASLTHEVRVSRSFERRAERSTVREIDALGEDFNSLLTEMQSQTAIIEAHHADLRRSNDSLRKQSRYDSLTDLPNRAYLGEHLGETLAASRAAGEQLGLLFIDTDRFKEVNDRFGHAVGDALLVELSQRLRAAVRESDFVARLGGDEFIIVIKPLFDVEEIERLTERIRARLDKPLYLPGGATHPISVTIGVAVFPDHADSTESLIRAADVAMYRAKATSRGSVATYVPNAAETASYPHPGAHASARFPDR